jgi:cysteine desulfurase
MARRIPLRSGAPVRPMIYLDNNASTKLDPEAGAAMVEAMELYGNPSSVHAAGRRARRAVEEAREEVARLVGASPDEIFFTSGGTEANAMAIFGAVAGRRGRLVRSGAEHPSVREPMDAAGESHVVDPEPSGALDAGRVLDAVDKETLLVSVMTANNEYGGLFPVEAIAAGARARGVLAHTDAVQAAGRVLVDVRALGVDLLSLSAHKLHGPKGAGALFVRKGVPLAPRTPGGGQEKRMRGGTENSPALVGFGVAARLARQRLEGESARIERLRDRLEDGILEHIPAARALGRGIPRLPNTSAIHFEGAAAEILLVRLDLLGVAVSAGSACSSGTLAPSQAILSLGLSRRDARQVIRFSLSRWTREAEIDEVLAALPGIVADVLRAAEPLRPVATEPVPVSNGVRA